MTPDQLFQRLLTFILRPDHEGGYANDPQDPGKETMRGITAPVARKWGYFGPMRDLPIELTEKIYRVDYFDLCRCAELPQPLAALVFDAAVNQGPGAAGEFISE
jgi:lysozyme family protein